jgi:hypothetical protein
MRVAFQLCQTLFVLFWKEMLPLTAQVFCVSAIVYLRRFEQCIFGGGEIVPFANLIRFFFVPLSEPTVL